MPGSRLLPENEFIQTNTMRSDSWAGWKAPERNSEEADRVVESRYTEEQIFRMLRETGTQVGEVGRTPSDRTDVLILAAEARELGSEPNPRAKGPPGVGPAAADSLNLAPLQPASP